MSRASMRYVLAGASVFAGEGGVAFGSTRSTPIGAAASTKPGAGAATGLGSSANTRLAQQTAKAEKATTEIIIRVIDFLS